MGSEYAIQALIRRLIRHFDPRKHAELRSSAGWLIALLGLLIVGLLIWSALFGLGGQSANPSNLFPALAVAILCLGISALYFRNRIYFKRYSVFIYRFGKLLRSESYSSFDRAELGPLGAPLQIVRKDGSVWKLPNPEDDESEIRGELLWRLARAGIQIPDETARLNRFQVGGLTAYSLGAFRDQPFTKYKEGLMPSI